MTIVFKYNLLNFIILQIILFYIVFIVKNKKLKNFLFLIFLVFFSIYLGARDLDVGVDTYNYARAYLSGNGGYFYEKGFKYLGYFLYKLNFSITNYFIAISLLSTFLYYKGYTLFYKKREELYLVLWVFLFNVTNLFGHVNILRQFIAGGFLLISIGFLNKNKKFWSILFFLIGFSFHKSMLFFSFVYSKILYNLYLKLSLKKKLLLIFLILLFSILIPYLLLWNPKFYKYFYIMKTNRSFYLKYILMIIFYSCYLIKHNNRNRNVQYFIFYGLCILTLFIRFQLLSSRLIYYINIFIPILLIDYLNKSKKNKQKIVLFLIQIYHIGILFYPSFCKEFNYLIFK